MPRPLSTLRPGVKWSTSINAIDEVPDLAPDICKLFAAWANVEHQLEMLFVEITGGSSRSVLAVFDSLESDRAKRDAIRAAAKIHLQRSDIIALETALKMVKTAGKARHRFAHHLWGAIDGMPKAISLTPPSAAAHLFREVRLAIYNARHTRNLEPSKHLDEPHTIDKVMVYTQDEICQCTQSLKECSDVLFNLQILIHARNNPFSEDIGFPKEGFPYGFPGTIGFARRQLMSSRLFRQVRRRTRDNLRNKGHP